jgi:hypothetical protein
LWKWNKIPSDLFVCFLTIFFNALNRCAAYCNEVCRNKHQIDCGALLEAKQALSQSDAMQPKMTKQPTAISKTPQGAFDALLDDDDDEEEEEEGRRTQHGAVVSRQVNPAVRPASSNKSSAKSSNKSAPDLYAKLGRALAGTTTTTAKRPTNIRPGTLANPTRSGRTTLGQELDSQVFFDSMMMQDIVVHHNPLGSILPPEQVCKFTGVFEPEHVLGAHFGAAVFERNTEKTYSLFIRFEATSKEADDRLIERGIFLQYPPTPSPLFLVVGPPSASAGLIQWYITDAELLMTANLTPHVYSSRGQGCGRWIFGQIKILCFGVLKMLSSLGEGRPDSNFSWQ